MVRLHAADYGPSMKHVAHGWAAALLLVGCSMSANLNGRSFGTTPGASSSAGGAVAQVTMPDLAGKTPEQAVAILRSAGINVVDTRENDSDLCGESDDDHSMTPQGTICKHTPMAGASVSAQAVRLAYTVEHDRYEGGSSPRPWRRMPALVGMTLDAARATLARAQLSIDANFDVEVVESERCAPGTVCETSPPAKIRKMLGLRGRIYVGAPRAVAAPAPPTAPTPPAAPTQPTAPASQPSAQPDVYF